MTELKQVATDWFPPLRFVRLDPPTGGGSIDLTTHIHRSEVALADESSQTRPTAV